MNPSRLFILRPVATSLLMVAILLAGIVAYRVLPLSALPEVDYPTIQVVTLYPGASPDVMTSSVTAPLERQFGQMPGLNQMSSTSSGGASVITLQFSLDAVARRRRAGSAGGDQRGSATSCPPTCRAADLQQGQSGRRADPHARAHVEDAAAAASSQNLADTRIAQKISQLPGVGLVSISGGQRPAVRIQVEPEGARRVRPRRSTTCAPRSPTPTSTRPRAASTARRARPRSTPTTSCKLGRRVPAARSSPTRTARRSASPTSPTSSTARRTRASPRGRTTRRRSSSTSSASRAPT